MDIGLAAAAGFVVIVIVRVVEGFFNVSADDFLLAMLSTLAFILVLRYRGAWKS
jgi:hypothetical protein